MTTARPTAADAAPAPLRRAADDRILLGVCGGIARALGTDVAAVRLALAATMLLGGAGVGLYAAVAIAMPGPGGPARPDPSRMQTATAVVMLAGATAVALSHAGLLLPVGLLWPATLILAGLGLAWRHTGGDTARPPEPGWARPALAEAVRAGAALALILGAGAVLLVQTGGFAGAAGIAVTASVMAAGVALLLGPRIARARAEAERERAERIRAQERVDVAARLHDSVLQTLALIQRTDDAARAQMLARGQERDLRAWLSGGRGHGGTLSAALAEAAGRVEERYGVAVDLVQPSDADLDDRLAECVAAAGEAMTNAAKHAGVDRISVLARVTDHEVSVFVRDRGGGFDPAAVPVDRRGLADSVVGRMERAGGTVHIETAPGEGAAVELVLPRRRA